MMSNLAAPRSGGRKALGCLRRCLFFGHGRGIRWRRRFHWKRRRRQLLRRARFLEALCWVNSVPGSNQKLLTWLGGAVLCTCICGSHNCSTLSTIFFPLDLWRATVLYGLATVGRGRSCIWTALAIFGTVRCLYLTIFGTVVAHLASVYWHARIDTRARTSGVGIGMTGCTCAGYASSSFCPAGQTISILDQIGAATCIAGGQKRQTYVRTWIEKGDKSLRLEFSWQIIEQKRN